MKTKKQNRVNLDKKRNLFFLIGLTIALGVSLMAFEWKTDTKTRLTLDANWNLDEVEMLPITRPPEPPKPKIVKKIHLVDLKVVKDDEPDVPDLDVFNTEFTDEPLLDVPFDDDDDDDNTIIDWVLIQDKPTFKGGMDALNRFLVENTKYPEIAKTNEIEGVVYVEFVIGKDGVVKDVKIKRGIDPYLDREALRVMNLMPKWKPGRQRGQAVNVSFILPFRFKLYN